jgi:NTE family protein
MKLGSCQWPWFFIIGFLAALSLPLTGAAAEQGKPRPKIGLVLSGGGARGAAHIGVLQVLEELHIPVDYIAGTSMGSIIGGLYAMGTPVEDIEKLTTKIDWEDIFSDRIPRQKQYYRRKGGKENYLLRVDVDSQKGLTLPPGLLTGKKLDLTLRSLSLGAGNDFDLFPIPYRAVATDIESGEMVVLSKGDLAESMRASMAIPGVFIPVEIDGRLLVDGGVARNLPVDVVRAMGADVVIAINIGTPLNKRDELDNFFAIAGQTTGFLTNRNTDAQIRTLQEGDLLITPDLGDIATASFTRMDDAVKVGRKAAGKAAAELSRYSVSEDFYQEIRSRQLKRSTRVGEIYFVDARQEKILRTTFLPGRLKKTLDKPLEPEDLAREIFEIYNRAEFKDIDFKLIERDGKPGIELYPVEKARIQHHFELGFQLNNDLEGNTSHDILIDYYLTQINNLDTEWKNTFRLGNQRQIFSEIYQPLNTSGWRYFLAPYVRYDSVSVFLFEDSEKRAEYRIIERTGGLDLGLQLQQYGEVRLGMLRGKFRNKLDVGEQTLPENAFDNGAYKAAIVVDQIDNTSFPRSGLLFDSTFFAGRTSLGADEKYNLVKTTLVKPIAFDRSTIIFKGRWDSVLSSTREFNNPFFLGGLFDLSGLAPNQLHGKQLVLGEVIYFFKLLKKKVFGNDLYVGASYEAGNVWDRRSDVSSRDLINAGSIFLGAASLIGPVYFGFGHAEGDNNAVYLYIGALF